MDPGKFVAVCGTDLTAKYGNVPTASAAGWEKKNFFFDRMNRIAGMKAEVNREKFPDRKLSNYWSAPVGREAMTQAFRNSGGGLHHRLYNCTLQGACRHRHVRFNRGPDQ